MPQRLDAYLLNVGQGSANFFAVYDTGVHPEVPVTTVLADLGSGSSNFGSSRFDESVNFVAETLRATVTAAKPAATLDLLVLSHSDNDHINLVGRLLRQFSPDGSGGLPQLIIGRAVYGGWYGQYRKGKGAAVTNVLDTLQRYLAAPTPPAEKAVVKLQVLTTDFRYTSRVFTETSVFTGSGLRVSIIMMNAPSPATGYKDDIVLNTRSAILLVTGSQGGVATNFVVTGDATALSFLYALQRALENPRFNPARMNRTYLMTVPHHGSERTATCAIPAGSTAMQPEWDLFDRFNRACRAQLAVASAGDSSHRHPRASVLDRYATVAGTGLRTGAYQDPAMPHAAGHLYTAYLNGAERTALLGAAAAVKPRYTTLPTQQNVFSTLYCYPSRYERVYSPGPAPAAYALPTAASLSSSAVPQFVHWVATVDDAGLCAIERHKFTPVGFDETASATVDRAPTHRVADVPTAAMMVEAARSLARRPARPQAQPAPTRARVLA